MYMHNYTGIVIQKYKLNGNHLPLLVTNVETMIYTSKFKIVNFKKVNRDPEKTT